MTTQTHVRRVTIYRERGGIEELPPELISVECDHAQGADRVSLLAIMSRELLCVRPDLDIATVIHLIIDRHVGCLPVVDARRHPIGIITKYDLVEQLDGAMQLARRDCPLPSDLAAQTADDVMMPLALTLYEHATIAHASAMMVSEDTHHVLAVSDDGALVGVVSSMDIVRWVTEHGVLATRRDAGRRAPEWRPLEG